MSVIIGTPPLGNIARQWTSGIAGKIGSADYTLLFQANVGNGADGKVHVFKRLSGTSVWNEMDSAHAVHIDIIQTYAPAAGGIQQYCCWIDGAKIYMLILQQNSTAGPQTFHIAGWDIFSFDAGTDTWDNAGAFVSTFANGSGGATVAINTNASATIHTSSQCCLHMIVRGTNDYLFYHTGTPENIAAVDYGRLYRATFNGVTFGTDLLISGQTGISDRFWSLGGCHDDSGFDHYFGYIGSGVPNKDVFHVGENSGTLGSVQAVNPGFPTGLYYDDQLPLSTVSQPIVYNDNNGDPQIGLVGEFWTEPFDGSQCLGFINAAPALNPTWVNNTIHTGSDDISGSFPWHSDNALFPVHQANNETGIALAAESSGNIVVAWVTTDETTHIIGHVYYATSLDGVTWTTVVGPVLDADQLDTDDNPMTSVLVYPDSDAHSISIIGNQESFGNSSEESQWAQLAFAPPPAPPTCSLNSVITGSTVTLTWTTANTPTSAVIDQGVGAVDPTGGTLVLPLPGGATTYHLLVTNDDGSSTCQTTVTPPAPPAVGGCRTILMLWQGSFVSKPEISKDRFGDWDDGGTNHLKFYQGFRMKADTFGQPKIILVRDADAFALHNIQPATVQHNGEVTHAYSFDPPFYAHQVRDEPQDLVAWRRFGIEWVFELAPENVRTWQTQRTAHGITGYQHISRIEAAWSSAADVTLTVSSFDGQSPAPLTLPSTGGVKQKILLTLTPNKGTLYTYRAISSAPFQLWLVDWVTWVGAWNRQGPYMAYRNLGGDFGDAASI